ncbi:hypothetical protein LOZ64_006360 [Ophidiomyces ophidiicola]|nr:hypothetical protein LOZ64_006360 [Ophidiomyces ophidiicola]KAI2015808.1 hypothetical protein LOZ49_000393 [Ophidiomyces ophidiicola]KAI2026393.1 hypothetical protein LOZ46_000385 [Ophidiomyces ophidiicola]KAI2145274.1 hypothetical protein LOZ29_000437 [Ophidiomyces ophidiicola]KAI2147622.1 hypothetical protein LOZ28_000137 [Ophidiomyces ophidiicola]
MSSNVDLTEEIDAINAIYDPTTVTISSVTESSTTITLQVPDHSQISFLVLFDTKYPETSPKVVGTSTTGSSRGTGKKWVDVLSEAVTRVWTPGCVCLYDLIVEAQERFGEISGASEQEVDGEKGSRHTEKTGAQESGTSSDQTLLSSFGLNAPPPWIVSEPTTEKKSVFVARVAHVESKEEAERYLDYLLATERKIAAATHNITAWRIRQKKSDGSSSVVQDFDDDGETAAGGRMLHLMQLMDVWDVVVVVTRWYGGVKLGPDRFRIINAVARDALVKGGFDKSAATENQKKGKKKGKR